MISLERRLTLLVLALLCCCGLASLFTFYGSIRRAQEMELEHRLDVRLAWLGAAISVSRVEGGQIKLHKRREPEAAAPFWQVATHDGVVLWTSKGWPGGRSTLDHSETLVFGDRTLPAVEGRSIVSHEEYVWENVPPPVRTAAETAVPGLVVDQVDLADAGGTLLYHIDGRGRRRECLITIDGAGRLLQVVQGNVFDPESVSLQPRYRLTGGPGRIELRLTARTSSAESKAELARLGWNLKVIGPLALLLTGALTAALIRWQLRPLARMAEQASRIGPGSSTERIAPVGSNTECVQLRDAINGMLDRLADGLEREHRFASSAAHELRTPLAQLRTTIEVALRRDRDAGEYRAALTEALDDVERLQKLVLGLLHLARSGQRSAKANGKPVALADLLEQAERDRAPVLLSNRTLGDGLTVEGDESLLVAALVNVLENAERHAPGAPATVQVEEAGATIRLVVADRGPGVPPADRERIFEPLTQLGPACLQHDPTGGFGLGLAVARASGGDLECRGRSDGAPGAEFVFSLRRAPAPD